MKKIYIALILLAMSATGHTQSLTEKFSIPIKNWNLQLVSFDHFYPTYLADPLAVRVEVSSQKMLYSDFDFQDPVNSGGGYLGKLTIYPAGRISLLKFSPKSNPRLGISLDFGATIPTIMRAGNHDLIGTDGIYYFAVAAQPTEWLSLMFSKHHICTHVGDEFWSGGVKSPIDFDPNVTQLPVRDDFILMASVRPLWFLHRPELDILRVYGDFGFFFPGVDFMGTRQNKPHYEAWYNFQGGAEVEYYFKKEILGGVYGAVNISAYQLNGFSPNVSVTAGYLFPQQRFNRRFRIGLQYYNGRSLSNQYYNRKERFTAFTVGFDI